tara:strand:+ start:147788 stop:148585 length:798 start_codon:yes stop_codon:yes gene_type:complete
MLEKNAFNRQVLHENLAQSILQPDQAYPMALDEEIVSGDISLQGRLDIYRNNVIGGLIDVVMARYPIVEILVGDEFARAMARAYIISSPPVSGNLNEYGVDYPAFIAAFPAANSLPYLADIAQLEALEHQAYYAPEARLITLENAQEFLPRILANTASLALHPSVGVLKSEYALIDLKAFSLNAQNSDGVFDITAAGQSVLVWRFGFSVEVHALSLGEYSFLNMLHAGQGLSAALEAALNSDGNFDFEVFWTSMVQREIFTLNEK